MESVQGLLFYRNRNRRFKIFEENFLGIMAYPDTEKSAEFSQSLERMKESFLWAAAQGGNEQVRPGQHT
jgi:hypothetical protein